MDIAAQIKQDTLHLLLSNALHRDLPVKQRAMKIAKACKKVRDKTKDDVLFNACKSVISSVSKGNYHGACRALELTECNYWSSYK